MTAKVSDFYSFQSAESVERLTELARGSLEHWELADAELALVEYGENVVYRVTPQAGPPFALRVHRHGYHSDAEVRSELQWIKALGAHAVEVPNIVETRGGELFATVSGRGMPEVRQVDLFEWIEGQHLGQIGERLEADPAALARIYTKVGETVARLHEHALSWKRPHGFTRPSWDADGLAGERPLWGRFCDLALLSREECALVERARVSVREHLVAYGNPKKRYGLIHGDLVLENMLIDGDRVRLIDFDDAGDGWHLFDLVTVLSEYLGTELLCVVRDAVVEGYRRHRALADAELQHLSTFLMARGLNYLSWVHTRADTEFARQNTPKLITTACGLAEDYLAGRALIE